MKPILTPRRLDAALAAAGLLFDLPPRALTGRGQSYRVAHARFALWVALFRACNTTLMEVADHFDRHHTTVMHGVSRAREIAASDQDYAAALALIAHEARRACG